MQIISSKTLEKNAYREIKGLEIVIAGYVAETGLQMLEKASTAVQEETSSGVEKSVPVKASQKSDPAPKGGEKISVQAACSEAAVAVGSGAELLITVDQEGIYDVLYKIAEAGDAGLSVYLRKIPIRQETIEICNDLEENPYYLDSTGCVVILTNKAFTLEQKLQEMGIPAMAAGFLTKEKDKVILSGEKARMGQHRNYLFPPGSAKANRS